MDKNNAEFQQHEISWTPEKTSRLWAYYATMASHRDKYFGRRCGQEVSRILSRTVLGQSRRILDFSCGRGDLLHALSNRVRSDQVLFGCDFSETSVGEARRRLEGVPGFGKVFLASEIQSQSAAYDLILLTEVVEHLDDNELGQVLRTMMALLAPGGYIFITTPLEEDLDREKTMCPECGCVFHRWQHRRSWSVASLTGQLEQFGFRTELARPNLWGPWYVKLAARMIGRAADGIVYIGRKSEGPSSPAQGVQARS